MGREVYVALYDWAAHKLATGSVTFRELGEGCAGNVSVAASGESALPATSLPPRPRCSWHRRQRARWSGRHRPPPCPR